MGKHKLSVVLQVKDPGRVSSITIDDDPSTRKNIYPVYGKLHMEKVLYVSDCLSHDEDPRVSPQIGIRAKALRFVRLGLVETLGEVRLCPLCWRILDADFELPDPKPLVNAKEQQLERAASRKRGREAQKEKRVAKPTKADKILDKAEYFVGVTRGTFTLYDLMEATDLEKSPARKLLLRFMTEGRIMMYSKGGGRGKPSTYRRT